MTKQKKVITVVGATGKQGGSVARSLLQNPEFSVQCITRNAKSNKANELRDLGLKVVEADASNREHMQTILRDSWGVFVNNGYTMPDAARKGDYGLDFGNSVLQTAAMAGVPHVVFSSQPSADILTNGKIRTPILDVKAWGEAWARDNSSFTTFTPIMAAWYLEDFLMPSFVTGFGGFPLHEDSAGYLTLRSPGIGGREEVPWISIEDDFGDLVHGIFLDPLRWNYRPVQAVGDITSFGNVTSIFADVTKRKTRYIHCATHGDYEDLGRPELQESRDVFEFYQLRHGEVFGCGITENETAARLKQAAFRAKGGQGRETLTTCREWFQTHFSKVSAV